MGYDVVNVTSPSYMYLGTKAVRNYDGMKFYYGDCIINTNQISSITRTSDNDNFKVTMANGDVFITNKKDLNLNDKNASNNEEPKLRLRWLVEPPGNLEPCDL